MPLLLSFNSVPLWSGHAFSNFDWRLGFSSYRPAQTLIYAVDICTISPRRTPIMTSNPDSEWQDTSSSTLDTSEPPIKDTQLPKTKEIRRQELRNNCVLRSVANGILGGGLGLTLGLLTGGSKDPAMPDKMTGGQQLIYRAKLIARRSWTPCRNFALIGFMFAAAECIVEKARGERDIANVAVAGCVTGGAVYAKAGPKAACVGCASFGALAAFLEKCAGRVD